MIRRLTPPQLVFDVTIASLCFLLRVAIGFENPAIAIVVVLMASALAIRRLSPPLALIVAWVGAVVQLVSLLNPDVSNLAILAVLYTTARYGGSTTRWAGLVSAGVGSAIASVYVLALGFLISPPISAQPIIWTGYFVAVLFSSAATLGLSWTLGLLSRTWDNAREVREQKRFAEQAMVIEQERNRIARDMHDVVAHSLAVVIAQADGARYARAKDPDAVDEALTTISGTAREALADVRILLGQLRHQQEPGPQPVLADLTRLFEQLRASGLVIFVETSGKAVTLPTSRQLAVYRIVQEALTNALRHGDAGQAVVVRLDWAEDAVEVTISNALGSTTPASDHAGHGIAGMRERALLVGGTFSTAAENATFVVSALIPVGSEVAA